jgi:hypothetical protein
MVPVPTGILLLMASSPPSDVSPRSVGAVTPQESPFEPDSSSAYLHPEGFLDYCLRHGPSCLGVGCTIAVAGCEKETSC